MAAPLKFNKSCCIITAAFLILLLAASVPADAAITVINSQEDLQKFRDDVNEFPGRYNGVTVTLGADIDLDGINWVPIGDYEKNKGAIFRGTFDGAGHSITNLMIDSPVKSFRGLFGRICKAEIKNLRVTVKSVSGENYIGGIAGYSDCGKITNCVVEVTGNLDGSYSVGGIAGEMYNDGIYLDEKDYDENYIRGCRVIINGRLYSCITAGGIAGSNYLGSITDCSVLIPGELSSSYRSDHAISGYKVIRGREYRLAGLITEYGAGGIVGYNWKGKITDCSASGNIIGKSEDGRTGGLAGYNDFWSSIRNSYASCSVSGEGCLGGIVGENLHSEIVNCFSAGTVSSPGDRAGGIAGLNNDGVILRCYSAGTVMGRHYVGGIAGENSGTGNFTASGSVISSSAAFNIGVTSTGHSYGRVCGSNSGSLDNNYAWKDMSLNGRVMCENPGGGNLDGQSVVSSSLWAKPDFYKESLGLCWKDEITVPSGRTANWTISSFGSAESGYPLPYISAMDVPDNLREKVMYLSPSPYVSENTADTAVQSAAPEMSSEPYAEVSSAITPEETAYAPYDAAETPSAQSEESFLSVSVIVLSAAAAMLCRMKRQ